ncbi:MULTISPECIES: DUF4852 domain-containing protein [unclassified Janthinobacterium]|uniref:DUF4852 domain-containing protein n=1 Tax=unclassified Janthinobacterium TaxID=2610881 RepID=UPI00161233CF|nr:MULTISPECIES: DUF4852 domain-containing protein [unclassified Janthinobacterium]MBB5367405.1 hypothetical protein [Janthinobacterium sp. K2C7]MBB5380117.1 hypothetical protein [Janthinobacterium sp. K2Li3]MBB5385787.1 hypothetical protein [Janthinobacterium sp. K2E3]
MLNSYKKPLLLALLTASLAACSDKAASPAPTLADATAPKTVAAIKQEVVRAALPKADKSTPAASYLELTSGNQLMYSYLSLAAMPIDYAKIAGVVSSDYARSSDEFHKNDLLKVLQPKIDAAVDQAGAQRYVRLKIDNPVNKYDFEQKGFPLDSSLWESGSTRYFFDNPAYKLSFSNGDGFRYLNVPAEDAARNIEGLRSKYQALQLVVYAFAQDADISQNLVRAEIVKVELIDKKGNVLASQ